MTSWSADQSREELSVALQDDEAVLDAKLETAGSVKEIERSEKAVQGKKRVNR